jgi:hypothetical protein
MQTGDRIMIVHVLVDDGPPEAWAYEFVADRARR